HALAEVRAARVQGGDGARKLEHLEEELLGEALHLGPRQPSLLDLEPEGMPPEAPARAHLGRQGLSERLRRLRHARSPLIPKIYFWMRTITDAGSRARKSPRARSM